MSENNSELGNPKWLLALGLPVLLIGGVIGWFWHDARPGSDPAAALSGGDRAAIEQVVREYILNNPEILPEAMQNLQQRENAKQLSGIRGDVEKPFPGAVMGNPDGKVTLVEFTDYACGYCRQSVGDVERLIKDNPDLRIVVRELPILSPDSAEAARMALAAAEQGKYTAFHNAMFAAGRPSAATIDAAAKAAGLDLAKAKEAAKSDRIEAELNRNIELAQKLGFSGTPSWVAGDELMAGAVGADRLAEAIDNARG
ncbi:MAG: thioredoxin domain-containing protein [Novosphingobium sp.]|nr:thioredoxin domain-containing protein [Novosphingobium sp.]